jgi:arylsulfatase A-like enzyme
MYDASQCLPVKRHAAERGADADPVLRAFQDEEVAVNFAQAECQEIVKPVYQGLITQLDDHLGRVFAEMERLGRWQDTLVISTADHGDYLGDHWLGEKELFHDCIQKVPFLLYDPSPAADATRGRTEQRLVEAVDVVPSILDALAQDPAEHLVEGRSLLGPDARHRGRLAQAAFSELDWTFRGARRRLGQPTGHHHAWMVRTERWKYVHWTSGYRPQLFDPGERPGRVPRPRRQAGA